MGTLNLKHYQNRHSRKSKVLRVIWNLAWLLLFRPTPRGILCGWRRFLLRCFGARIGKGASILPSCRIWLPENLSMGEYSCLSEKVDCYCVDKITLGNQAIVSQGTFLCTASHDIESPTMALTHKPIKIASQAWVAARAFVGPGVTVGEGAVVGACAVVTKDVAPWTVVAGNPAKRIGDRQIKDCDD
ncbi:MAG: putative colanic acid biosynthesis acetyltransferase [Candidatus Omnitrophica bacterium]|nr:putative colanic acid biosynthesis acetyltransferase [Candidatus Omnitrophota bacterium]